MKILNLIFLTLFSLLFATQSFAVITPSGGSYSDNTGTLIRKDSVTIKVRNNDPQYIATSSVVLWDYGATGDDGFGVVLSATGSNQGNYAACVTIGGLAAGQIGQCQVYGYGTVKITNQAGGYTATAGSALYVSNSPGRATGIQSAAATDRPVGIALDSSITTGYMEVFIKLL